MNRYTKPFFYFIVIAFTFFGCKSAKTVTANGELNTKASAKSIVKSIEKSKSNFKTLSGRIKIETIQGSKSQSLSVSMRIDKDKTIWISKLGLVRGLITPNRVAFYNKLDGSYFDGDFSYLSNLLGTELDFEKLQNILLGEPVYTVNSKDYDASTFEKSYLLQPKKQRELFELFLLINPSHFKMDSQQISQEKEARHLEVNYEAYQTVEKEILPENIKIIAIEKEEQFLVNIEMKNLAVNQELRFPFTIPSGYKELQLK